MKKYKLTKGFIVQVLGEELVIFDGAESRLFTFNETASFIFLKLKRGWNTDKIIQYMVKKYKVDRKRAVKDMEELLVELKSKNIITDL